MVLDLYPEPLENWNFDCAKAPGFDDRKEARIALILTSLRSIEPRELSRCPNSNFLTARGIDQALMAKGRFIIATNELDHNKLSAKEMLFNYKEQQAVERGFRFLKDPFFMTSSVFLKSQDRIVALGMVMCLCLLVYTIAQRFLRRQLEKLQASLPNQLGKPTKRPTMRWIFQLFEGVHLLIHRLSSGVQERVLNMNRVRYQVLSMLGGKFEKIYSAG